MHHFGREIASNPGELGILGERPTHPELLDWLAKELVQTGWSRKRLSREILTSETYRRSSTRPSGGQYNDPQKIWPGRTNVRRPQADSTKEKTPDPAGMLNLRMDGAANKVKAAKCVVMRIQTTTWGGKGTS